MGRIGEALEHQVAPPASSQPASSAAGLLIRPSAPRVSYRTLRQRHRWSTRAFAASCVLLAFLGAWMKPACRASTTVMVTQDPVQSEWALLRDESQEVDFAEQIRSRKVLEPALRRVGLFPNAEPTVWNWLASPDGREMPPAWQQAVRRVEGWWTLVSVPSDEDEASRLQRALKKFQTRLKVERVRHSAITRITVTDRDPVRASETANAVAQAWFDVRREQTTAQPKQLVAAVDRELEAIHSELEVLNTIHQQFSLVDASLAELTKELAKIEGELSSARSRYADTNPLVLHLRQEHDTLKGLMDDQTASRRQILEEVLSRKPRASWSLTGSNPEPGTIETAVAHGQHRYQELLQQRAQAYQVLALWQRSPTTSGNLCILDAALPPRASPRAVRVALALLAAVIVGLLGAALLPVLLKLWETRVSTAYRVWCEHLFSGLSATPTSTNGSHEHGRTT